MTFDPRTIATPVYEALSGLQSQSARDEARLKEQKNQAVELNDPSKWETRLLNCLNLVTENNFQSLTQASLFASTHQRVHQAIATYQPEPMG